VASCKRTDGRPSGVKAVPIEDPPWHERCNRPLSQGRNRPKEVLFEVPIIKSADIDARLNDPPPLKWSDLRYVFDIKEDCNGKEAIQA